MSQIFHDFSEKDEEIVAQQPCGSCSPAAGESAASQLGWILDIVPLNNM